MHPPAEVICMITFFSIELSFLKTFLSTFLQSHISMALPQYPLEETKNLKYDIQAIVLNWQNHITWLTEGVGNFTLGG